MIDKKSLKFRLRKDAGTYYFIDLGSFSSSATASDADLDASVIDWNKFQMLWLRDGLYKGVFRKFAPDTIRFCGDGAKILRNISNTMGGKGAICELEILLLNTTDQLYYPRVVCTIAFSKYTNSLNYVDVMLMQGGLSATLNAYDTTSIPIAIGDPAAPGADSSNVLLDGLMFKGSFNYQTEAGGTTKINLNTFGATFNTSLLGLIHTDNEGEYGVGVAQSTICDATAAITALTSPWDEKWNLKSLKTVAPGTQLDFSIDPLPIVINWDPGNTIDAAVEIWVEVRSADFTIMRYSNQISSPGTGFHPGGFSLSATLVILHGTYIPVIGDHLIVYYKVVAAAPLGAPDHISVVFHLPVTPVKARITYSYVPPPSVTRALSHWQVFRKLFRAMSGATYDPVSALLTTDVYPGPDVFNLSPVNTFFASGDAIRRLYVNADGTTVDPEIVTNMQDFAKDGFSSLGAAVGIEKDTAGNEVLTFEKLEHYYQKDVLIADLGKNITNWKSYPYVDYVANNLKAGYKDQTYQDTNGRFEPNAQVYYKTSYTDVNTQNTQNSDIDITDTYRADPYGIEFARLNLSNKQTTDSSSDNETFKMQSNGNRLTVSGVSPNPYQLDRAHTITRGLPADVATSIFNLPLSVGRCMGRLLKWLKSNYCDMITPLLTFQSGTKNTDIVSSMYIGPTVTENSNIPLTPTVLADEVLFIPTVFELDAEVDIHLPDLMETNPYGVFRFTITRDDNEFVGEGFALECGIQDAPADKHTFKLLLSPKTPMPEWL